MELWTKPENFYQLGEESSGCTRVLLLSSGCQRELMAPRSTRTEKGSGRWWVGGWRWRRRSKKERVWRGEKERKEKRERGGLELAVLLTSVTSDTERDAFPECNRGTTAKFMVRVGGGVGGWWRYVSQIERNERLSVPVCPPPHKHRARPGSGCFMSEGGVRIGMTSS